jgi:L-alanine-DL-glutamate epimerase-like enolase superfamily enzyme
MIVTNVTAKVQMGRRTRPMRDALQTLDSTGNTLFEITTDTGVVGRASIYFGRIERGPTVLATFVNEVLGPAVVGRDPFLVRGIRDDLWRLTDYHGTTGLALQGIAGIDIALWDVLGKAVEQPVWRLLGAQRDRVPAYAMVGWLNYELPELQRVCADAIEQGFRGVKMKVGAPTLAEDVERIYAVRAAIGDGPLLMVDANQVFALPEAMRRGQAYQDLGCYWFEEPLRADDHAGLAQLAQRLDIPIASGENDFGKRQFRDLFERRAVDIVQPDLRRAGGLTECLEIGLMADAFNIPYASHGGGVHLHVLAALPNTLLMESGPLPKGSPVRLVDGCFLLPEAPGFGGEAE